MPNALSQAVIVNSSLLFPESPNTECAEGSSASRTRQTRRQKSLTDDAVVVGWRHVGDGDRHEARAEVEVGDQGLEDWAENVSIRRPSRRWKESTLTDFLPQHNSRAVADDRGRVGGVPRVENR